MKPRVNSIQVMKACYKRDYDYTEYVKTATAFRVYPHSKNAYEYHCMMWTNLIGD
jgi:hypothetical protein